MMSNLCKCTRCKSTIDISYFGMNRKKEPYKTCDNCRNKTKQTKSCNRNRNRFMVHLEIESWYSSDDEQDDTWTQCYKQSCKEYYHYARKNDLELEDVLKDKGDIKRYADILYQKRINTNDEIQWNECLISSDDDEEVKEKKSMLAMKKLGFIQMF